MNGQVTAMILAGGQSSRMGRDKALISIAGVPLLRSIYNIAAQCTPLVFVITPWQERYRDILPSECKFIQEIIQESNISGEIKTHGPLLGFRQGLTLVETEWVLLLACDLPLLNFEVLADGIKQLNNVSDEIIAVLPRHSKGWEPLCGFYRRSCLPMLIDFINSGGRSFQQWLRKYPVQELILLDKQVLFNCNTPDELASVGYNVI